MDAPAPLLAKQWKKLYDIGFKVGPATYLLNSVTFGWLASRGASATTAESSPAVGLGYANHESGAESTSSSAFKLYVTAAILLPSSILYTLLIIKPVNDKLEERVRSLASASLTDATVESGVSREETTHALVDKWATLNLGRAIIAVTGALCATYAALSKIDVRGITAIGLGKGADRMG